MTHTGCDRDSGMESMDHTPKHYSIFFNSYRIFIVRKVECFYIVTRNKPRGFVRFSCLLALLTIVSMCQILKGHTVPVSQ